jgi:hypothetical protein
MDTIDQHIQRDVEILNNPITSSQSRRHIEEELAALEAYKVNHPDDSHDPTTLELYCDANPDALECRVYEY